MWCFSCSPVGFMPAGQFIGVCVSVGLAMVRVLTGLNIFFLLIPGYGISLTLSFFVPPIFTGIAFDSGGVASGPMTAAFLLPFAMSDIFTIVERGKGAAAIKLFTRNQVYLHTQFPGRGTATSEIMDILGLGTTEKDIIISYATAAAAGRLLSMLDNEMRGAVTSGGIIFSLLDGQCCKCVSQPVEGDVLGDARFPQQIFVQPPQAVRAVEFARHQGREHDWIAGVFGVFFDQQIHRFFWQVDRPH